MQSNPKRILIVDDCKDARDVYELWLSMRGYNVAVAGDGQEGLDKALQVQPDLVIMDLSLPVVSGWEATRRLKTDERTRHIPILILTGHEVFDPGRELGCDGFLIKPCLPDTMLAEVIRILNRQSPAEGGEASAGAQAAGSS